MWVERDRSRTLEQGAVLTGGAISLKPFLEAGTFTTRTLGNTGTFDDLLRLFEGASTPKRVNQLFDAWQDRFRNWSDSEQNDVRTERKRVIEKRMTQLRTKADEALKFHSETLIKTLFDYWTKENPESKFYKVAGSTTGLPIQNLKDVEVLGRAKKLEVVAQLVARFPDASFFNTLKTDETKEMKK